MFYYNQYVRAQSLDEAYELYQKKPNFVLGGMLWLKMKNKTLGTAIDLCDLGLDQIDEDENEFRIGAYATLRQIETHEALNAYTHGAIAESVRHIVGVQFRNVATVGGSIWGRFGFSDVMTIFRALGAKVQLHKAGIMDLDEFAALPRTTRDVLVSVIVPKKCKGRSILKPEKSVNRLSGAHMCSGKQKRQVCGGYRSITIYGRACVG